MSHSPFTFAGVIVVLAIVVLAVSRGTQYFLRRSAMVHAAAQRQTKVLELAACERALDLLVKHLAHRTLTDEESREFRAQMTRQGRLLEELGVENSAALSAYAVSVA